MSSALDCVQRPGDWRHGGAGDAAISRPEEFMQGNEGYLLRDGVGLTLPEVSELIARAEVALPVKRSFDTVFVSYPERKS